MTITEIEQAIKTMPSDKYEAFRAWFTEYDAERWDKQIETDFQSGKLDALLAEAQADYEAGNIQPL